MSNSGMRESSPREFNYDSSGPSPERGQQAISFEDVFVSLAQPQEGASGDMLQINAAGRTDRSTDSTNGCNDGYLVVDCPWKNLGQPAASETPEAGQGDPPSRGAVPFSVNETQEVRDHRRRRLDTEQQQMILNDLGARDKIDPAFWRYLVNSIDAPQLLAGDALSHFISNSDNPARNARVSNAVANIVTVLSPSEIRNLPVDCRQRLRSLLWGNGGSQAARIPVAQSVALMDGLPMDQAGRQAFVQLLAQRPLAEFFGLPTSERESLHDLRHSFENSPGAVRSAVAHSDRARIVLLALQPPDSRLPPELLTNIREFTARNSCAIPELPKYVRLALASAVQRAIAEDRSR